MTLRRTLVLGLLLVTGLGVQTALLGEMPLLATKPDLMLVLVLCLALVEGPAFGATAGFVIGMGTDAILQLPQGITALTFTLAGFTVGRIRGQLQSPSAGMPIAMVGGMTFCAVLFYGSFSMLLGSSLSGLMMLRHAALSAAYNGLLTPLVYPIVRTLATATRPRATEVMR